MNRCKNDDSGEYEFRRLTPSIRKMPQIRGETPGLPILSYIAATREAGQSLPKGQRCLTLIPAKAGIRGANGGNMSDYFDSHTESITGGTDMDNALQQAHATFFTATAAVKQTALISDGLTSVDVQDSTLELHGCEG